MIKKLLFRLAAFGIGLVLVVFLYIYFQKGPQQHSSYKGPRKVTIKNENGRYSFYKDGKPFLVKGGAGYNYLKELAASGGNTVMCWDTSKFESTLKEAAQYNVSVILGLDIPTGDLNSFYEDEKKVTDLYNNYSKVIARYKGNGALLAWCLGNELTIPFSFTTSPFYKAYNRLLEMIHSNDPDHPVSTTFMNVGKRNILNMHWRVPALDFVCINTYNQIKIIQKDMGRIKLLWDGPYLVSEWAPNGVWESNRTTWDSPLENPSTKKAEQYYDLYRKYMPLKDPRFLGSLVFYWGYRMEGTHTWYGSFNEDGTPNEIQEVLNDCWKGTVTKHKSPRVKYMLIDGVGGQESIIVNSKSVHKASIVLEDTEQADSLRYSWQILKESWFNEGQNWNDFKKPAEIFCFPNNNHEQNPNFTAPTKEGPYRVFVTVYNSKGYCATANIPIYVVD